MSKYWAGAWNPQLGLAVMEQKTPQENSQMVVAILLPKERAENLAASIVSILESELPASPKETKE